MPINSTVRDALKVFGPLALVLLILVILVMRMVAPPPPMKISFAAGPSDGQYYALAQQYQTALSEHGIDVTILETAGTLANFELLEAEDADVGFIQGGLAGEVERAYLETLGGVLAEPLWIFVRAEDPVADIGALRDRKLAVGPDGSGTRALVEQIQALWGGDWSALDSRAGRQAVAALRADEVDAALFAASIDADYVEDLLHDPGIRLLPILQAEALSMRMPALAPLTLYHGVVDFDAGLPAANTPLIAAVTQLAVRDDLHPALQAVLLEVAETIHMPGTMITRGGQFPNVSMIDLPLSPEARRYYRDGPTFLRRYFSFGLANFLERAWVFLIPLVTVMIPLVQLAPPVYRWRIRRKIYVWYNDLHDLERQGFDSDSAEVRKSILDQIWHMQQDVAAVQVPTSYNDELYRLRSHIDFVEDLIRRRDGDLSASEGV